MAHKHTLGTGITNGDFANGDNWVGGEAPISGADWFTIKAGDTISISSQTYSGFSPPTGQVNTVEQGALLTISISNGSFALGGDFYNNGSVDIPYPAGFSYSGGIWHGNLPSGFQTGQPGGFQVSIEGEEAIYFWHYNSDQNGAGYPWSIAGTYAKPVVLWYGGYQYGGYSGHLIAPGLTCNSWPNVYCTWFYEDETTIHLGTSGSKYFEDWGNGQYPITGFTPTVHTFDPITTAKNVALEGGNGGQLHGNIDTAGTITGDLTLWTTGTGSSTDAGMLKYYGMGGQEKPLGTLVTSKNVVCAGNVTGTVEFTGQDSYGRGGNVEYRHSRVFNTTIPKGGF